MNQGHKNRFASLIEPLERLKISEWADRFAYLPAEGNNEPGKYLLRRMPHQAAMLDDPLGSGVREVFHMMASQAAGKTCCGIIRQEYVIKVLKRSMLMVRATKETAGEWMENKFLPTVESTPAMDGLLVDPRKRNSRSKALNRRYPGGTLKVIGANSRSAFRGSSCGWVEQDEIDAYEVNKEGDPCALADRATITFSDAVRIKYSTPTIKDLSRIEEGYLRGDQQKYFLPCPICGEFQDLKFEQLKFSFTAEESARFEAVDGTPIPLNTAGYTWELSDKDSPFPIINTSRALYVCEHCRHGWTDVDRINAYMSGHPDNPPVFVSGKELRAEWRATAPFTGVRSRHLNGMYLTIGLEKGYVGYLQQFVENFLKAKKGGRETLMAWVNMFLALAFEDVSEKTDWKPLMDRAEDYKPSESLPAQVCWINFGADVQENRVEILSYGWGVGQESWVLTPHVIYGDLDKPEMAQRVNDYILNQRFKHPVLGELGFRSGFIDSQHKTTAVYRLVSALRLHNVWAVSGRDELAGVIEMKKERRFGGMRANLDVSAMKAMVYSRLRNTETSGPTVIHFHKGLPATFYLGLCSEKCLIKKMPNGGKRREWVKLSSSTRNEVLDMTNYAFGNYIVCKPDFEIEKAWREVQAAMKEIPEPLPDGVKPINPDTETTIPEQPKAEAKPHPRRKIRIASPFGRF